MGIFPSIGVKIKNVWKPPTQLFSGIKLPAYSVIGHFQHNLAHADESCLCESFLAGIIHEKYPP